jgi:uncharacterized peroxidase-related enzyme
MRLATAQALPLWRQRLFVALTRLSGAELDDVGKSCLRWPHIWGRPVLALAQEVLRGPSNWTVGERELFAAVVSEANSCSFCLGTHATIADRALPTPGFADWGGGAAGAEATAAARFVVKLTRAPEEIGPQDVADARAAGVSDGALAEAIYIAFLFNLINRVVDALEFTHRSDRDRVRGAEVLRRMGYRLPRLLFAGRRA